MSHLPLPRGQRENILVAFFLADFAIPHQQKLLTYVCRYISSLCLCFDKDPTVVANFVAKVSD